MKKFKLSGRLVVDIEIEVEASDYDTAWNKVYKMDVSEIIDKATIKESDLEKEEE